MRRFPHATALAASLAARVAAALAAALIWPQSAAAATESMPPTPTAAAPATSAPDPAPPRVAPEVRATWLTTTANNALDSPAAIADTMQRLADLGLNTVYIEAWKNGRTQFPSPTLDRVLQSGSGSSASARPPAPDRRDLLGNCVIEAHRHGLRAVAWFEYGFMAAHAGSPSALQQGHPDWLTTTADGEVIGTQNPFAWLNPLRPESRALLTGIVTDAIRGYDLDGVQLDDRIAWPVTMGYDAYTRSRYAADHGGSAPPTDAYDADWTRWRADHVSVYAAAWFAACRAADPGVRVTVSPAITPWSYTHYACDWPAWAAAGLMDGFVPQVYRTTFDAFAEAWPAQLEAMSGRRGDLIAGLRVVGEGDPTPWPDLERMVALARETGAGGHAWWFSRGVLDVYADEIAALYGGRAAAPDPWRPPPLVLSRDSDHAWHHAAVPAGRYRLVRRDAADAAWRVERRITQAETGPLELNLTGDAAGTELELLVDRSGGSHD